MIRWPLVNLEQIADISAGNPAPQGAEYFCPDGYPFVRMQDVGRKHIDSALTKTVDRVSQLGISKFGLRLYPAGTVLIPKSGASVNLNHRAMLGCDAYVVSHLATIVPNRRYVLPSYLFHWSQHYDPRSNAQVTSLPSLPLSLIKTAQVPLPSLDEQQRIVGTLDQIAEIKSRSTSAAKKCKDIIPALFAEMFGNPLSTQKEWRHDSLENLCDLVRGSSPRPQGDPKFFGGPIPRLMISDITRDGTYVTPCTDSLTVEGAARSRPMKTGSVVMAVSGAVGLPAILAVDACIHDGFVGFRELSNQLEPLFFYYYLSAVRGSSQKQAVGATFQNLNTDQIRRWNIPVPPKNIQQLFVKLAQRLETNARAIDVATSRAEDTIISMSGTFF